jgi:hypothetical protein
MTKAGRVRKHIVAGRDIMDMGGTFVTVSDSVEIDVVVIIAKEHETEPRVEAVDGNDKEDAHDPSLFVRTRVIAKKEVNL